MKTTSMFIFFILSILTMQGKAPSITLKPLYPPVGADSAKTKWEYRQSIDKMEGDTNFFATNTSADEVQFKFPYDGGSTSSITVRKMQGSIAALYSISKGQIIGETARVKFDSDKPITINLLKPSDGRSDVVFFSNPEQFIARLKTAKTVIIEMSFYEEGNRQIEFDTQGIVWNH